MGISFRSDLSATKVSSTDEILETVNGLANKLDEHLKTFRSLNLACARIKDCLVQIGTTRNVKDKYVVPECTEAIQQLRIHNPNHSSHDAYAAVESVLEETADKAEIAADTLVTTTRKYAEEVFNFHSSRFNEFKPIYKRIKFATSLNSGVTVAVVPHNDFIELYSSAREVVKDVVVPNDLISKLQKTDSSEDRKVMVVSFAKTVMEEGMGRWLKEHSLADLIIGDDVNERKGIVNCVESNRTKNLEHTQRLIETGWTLPKLKEAAIQVDTYALQTSSTGYYSLKDTYNRIIDFIDEVRRYSAANCVRDPYLCTALNLYAVMLIQQLSIIAVVIDKLHNTVIRLEQACQFGGKV